MSRQSRLLALAFVTLSFCLAAALVRAAQDPAAAAAEEQARMEQAAKEADAEMAAQAAKEKAAAMADQAKLVAEEAAKAAAEAKARGDKAAEEAANALLKKAQADRIAAEAALAAAGKSPAANPAKPFPGNPLCNPDFVPVFVNVQNLTEAPIYAAAGINCYDSIDDIVEQPADPRQFAANAETLKKLRDCGIYLVADQSVWGRLKDNPAIVGWVSPVDEPDNIQDKSDKAMPLDAYLAQSKTIKEFDPAKPYFVCFGQGLINDLFKGRGIDRSEYPKYMAPVDFIQYDVYPITNSKREDGEKHLELVGQGVSRIREWTDNKKPVMCWIETTHINDAKHAPTPSQTACEVWITMVHGARGVGYFCHDFTAPKELGRARALSRDKDMLAQLKVTNAKLQKLARIISAPLAAEPAEAKVAPPAAGAAAGKVIFSTKNVTAPAAPAPASGPAPPPGLAATEKYLAVLAVNVLGDAAKATIPVAGLKKGTKVEVLEESRTVTADDGSLTDDFAPYQEHVYKIGQ